MTFIFDVMIWGREGTKVEGRLTSLLGYSTKFYRGPEFGLQILMDAWFRGFGAADIDKSTEAEFEECFELFLGKQVWTDKEGFLLEESTKDRVEPHVKAAEKHAGHLEDSTGSWDGHDYRMLKPRRDLFLERTAAVIGSFDITGAEDGMKAHFTIEATDPKYVAHLEKNVYFQTTFTGHLPK